MAPMEVAIMNWMCINYKMYAIAQEVWKLVFHEKYGI